jgi:hypothetical protein
MRDTRQHAEQVRMTIDHWMKQGGGILIDSLHTSVGDLPFLAVTGDLMAYASPAASFPAASVSDRIS